MYATLWANEPCEFRAAAPSLRVTERVTGVSGGALAGERTSFIRSERRSRGAEGVHRGNVPVQSGGLAER